MRIAILAFAAAALVTLASGGARADIYFQLDEPAKEVPCTRWWNGKAPKIASLKGRVALIHFSDPAKLTSKAFVSQIRSLHAKYKDKGLVVIEVLQTTWETEAEAYFGRESVEWHLGLDSKGTAQANYMGSSLPRSYLIGPGGKVAWHAHVAALTPSVVQNQLDRIPFFALKEVPTKAKAMCKLAGGMKFGSALEVADKLLADRYAKDAEKRLAAAVKREVDRSFDFHWRVLEKKVKDLDWGIAWRLAERMNKIYKNTPHSAQAAKQWNAIQKNPRAVYVLKAQNQLEKIVKKTKDRRKKNLQSVVRELKLFREDFTGTEPANKADDWIRTIEGWLEGKK